MNHFAMFCAAIREIGRVVRIFQVGGRRVERFVAEQRVRIVHAHVGPNRHERRRNRVLAKRFIEAST